MFNNGKSYALWTTVNSMTLQLLKECLCVVGYKVSLVSINAFFHCINKVKVNVY